MNFIQKYQDDIKKLKKAYNKATYKYFLLMSLFMSIMLTADLLLIDYFSKTNYLVYVFFGSLSLTGMILSMWTEYFIKNNFEKIINKFGDFLLKNEKEVEREIKGILEKNTLSIENQEYLLSFCKEKEPDMVLKVLKIMKKHYSELKESDLFFKNREIFLNKKTKAAYY